jgi:hypothetical protein
MVCVVDDMSAPHQAAIGRNVKANDIAKAFGILVALNGLAAAFNVEIGIQAKDTGIKLVIGVLHSFISCCPFLLIDLHRPVKGNFRSLLRFFTRRGIKLICNHPKSNVERNGT